jgi:hypothetical protein
LHFYGARFYDSGVGRFVSADTVIPGGTQGYDRYAYTSNNPLRYTDPTGHKECDYDCQVEYQNADPDYEYYGYWVSCWGAVECLGIMPNSVAHRAFRGEPGAIVDALVPTDIGLRGQVEIVTSFDEIPFFLPSSVTFGAQATFNRNDGNLVLSGDVSPEGGYTFSPELPFGGSGTAGLVLGWFSNSNQNAGTGKSAIGSFTLAGGEAVSGSLNTQLHFDKKYGTLPISAYLGVGKGGGYASVGGGATYSMQLASFNVYQFFSSIFGGY